jgi:TRAP-type uncharacterized transport system substrate-binding protein
MLQFSLLHSNGFECNLVSGCVCFVCAGLATNINNKGFAMKKGIFKKGVFTAACVALSVTLLFAHQAEAAAPALKTFTVTSGPLGGDFYALGGVIGEAAKGVLPGTTVSVNTGGAVENVLKIEGGKADLGTGMVKLYLESLRGDGAYAGREPVKNVKVMMYVTPMPMSFFLVREDSPFKSIADIARD